MKSTINLGHDSLELMNARYRQKRLSSERSLVLIGPVTVALYVWPGGTGTVCTGIEECLPLLSAFIARFGRTSV